MTILDRYLLKNFSRSFFYGVLVFLVVFFVAILVGQIETFVRYQASFTQMARFFLNHVPFIFVQITPLATLLATLFTLGGMSQRNEITALKANGISVYRMSVSLLVAAFFLSLFTIFLNEYIVPFTNHRFRQILMYEIRREKFSPFGTRSNIAYRGEEGNVYYVDHFNGEANTLSAVTILRFDSEGALHSRIDAKEAHYRNNRWLFHNGVERTFVPGQPPASFPFKEKVFPLKETADDFRKRQKLPSEMTYKELSQSVEKLKASAGDYKRDQVYLYFTISYPFAALFMAYLAIPFALFNNRSNPIINFGVCLVIAFVYWTGIAISHSLGVNGFFPPLLAAWSANVIFGLLGSYFYARALT